MLFNDFPLILKIAEINNHLCWLEGVIGNNSILIIYCMPGTMQNALHLFILKAEINQLLKHIIAINHFKIYNSVTFNAFTNVVQLPLLSNFKTF